MTRIFISLVGWFVILSALLGALGLCEFRLFIGPAKQPTPLPPAAPVLTAVSLPLAPKS